MSCDTSVAGPGDRMYTGGGPTTPSPPRTARTPHPPLRLRFGRPLLPPLGASRARRGRAHSTTATTPAHRPHRQVGAAGRGCVREKGADERAPDSFRHRPVGEGDARGGPGGKADRRPQRRRRRGGGGEAPPPLPQERPENPTPVEGEGR